MEKRNDFSENMEDVIHRQCQELDAWREKYRELSKMYDEQIEGTSVLVKDCDAWRDKYHALLKEREALKEKYEDLQEESAAMSVEQTNLRGKLARAEKACEEKAAELKEASSDVRILQDSNALMEEELKRVKQANKSLNELNDYRLTEIQILRDRGFWSRMFNLDK